MFSETAELYDLIYSRFKDYKKEVQQIVTLLKEIHPNARTILDAGCGTGEHARILSHEHGYVVDGIDLEPAFVRIAREKNPYGLFLEADMVTFDLSKRYDVIVCLFGAIGYVRTLTKVAKTLKNFSDHLAEGGVILVEPWITPEQFEPGMVLVNTVETENLSVCRMSHSEVEGNLSRIRFEYLIGTREGITHRAEVHELGLFTVDEMVACFEKAGLSVRFDEKGLFGRGLYTAKKSGGERLDDRR